MKKGRRSEEMRKGGKVILFAPPMSECEHFVSFENFSISNAKFLEGVALFLKTEIK